MFPFIFENSPLPCTIAIFLNSILLEISTFSSLLKSCSTLGGASNSNLLHTARYFSLKTRLWHVKQINYCWHIVHFQINIIFNGKTTNRTPIETSVTDCGNIIWSPQIYFLKRLTLSPSKISVSFFLDFLGWAVGDFLYLDFLYTFSEFRCREFPVTCFLARLLRLLFVKKILTWFYFPFNVLFYFMCIYYINKLNLKIQSFIVRTL